MNCNRCGKPIKDGTEEACWYCIEPLCVACWDEYGHCGHPETDAANERARAVPQPEQRETSEAEFELYDALNMTTDIDEAIAIRAQLDALHAAHARKEG